MIDQTWVWLKNFMNLSNIKLKRFEQMQMINGDDQGIFYDDSNFKLSLGLKWSKIHFMMNKHAYDRWIFWFDIN